MEKLFDLPIFQEWIKISLDLSPPSDIIHTEHGNLILGKKFSGTIFLKGLKMEGKNSAKIFKFGYNFVRGIPCRRQHISEDSGMFLDHSTPSC